MQGHIPPFGRGYGNLPMPSLDCTPSPIGMHPSIISSMPLMPPRLPPTNFFSPLSMPPHNEMYHPAMYNVMSPSGFTPPAPSFVENVPKIPNPPPVCPMKDSQKPIVQEQVLGPPLPAAQRGPTVYIGHLSPDCDDVLMRQLLQECGRVIRWTRTTDPATKRPSTFGFCEFESPLGVIRAVNCLNNLVIDGQALIANCEDRFKEGLNQWKAARKHKLQEENPSKSNLEIDNDIEREEEKLKTITQKIAADWNARNAANKTLIPDPEPVPEPAVENKPESEPNDLRTKWYESLVDFIDIYGTTSLSSKTLNRIRAWNNRVKENRIEFRKRLQNWQRKEPYLAKEYKNFKEYIDKQLNYVEKGYSESRVKRLMEYDMKDIPYYLTSDGVILEDVGQRRHYELMEQLRLERSWDRNDRKLEEKEEKMTQMNEAIQESIEPEPVQPEFVETPVVVKDSVDEIMSNVNETKMVENDEEMQTKTQNEENNLSQDLDSEIKSNQQENKYNQPFSVSKTNVDSIKNDQEVSRDEIEIAEKPKNVQAVPTIIKISLGSTLGNKQQSNPSVVSPRQKDTAEAFTAVEEEEEEQVTFRKHAPLSKLETPLHRDNKVRLPPELVMKLAAQVPKNQSAVFAFEIDWLCFQSNNIIQTKVLPWIQRKVVEFLGEEEPSLVEFIVSKLENRVKPQKLVKELEAYLDEDANGFIVKLWKLLIFEHLRLKADDKTKQNSD